MKDIKVGSINKCIEPLSNGQVEYETPIMFRRSAQIDLMRRAHEGKSPAIAVDTIRHALMNQNYMGYEENVCTIIGNVLENGVVSFLKMEFRVEDEYLDLAKVDLLAQVNIGTNLCETKKLIRKVNRLNKKRLSVARD